MCPWLTKTQALGQIWEVHCSRFRQVASISTTHSGDVARCDVAPRHDDPRVVGAFAVHGRVTQLLRRHLPAAAVDRSGDRTRTRPAEQRTGGAVASRVESNSRPWRRRCRPVIGCWLPKGPRCRARTALRVPCAPPRRHGSAGFRWPGPRPRAAPPTRAVDSAPR
jgi:hypothetical protein